MKTLILIAALGLAYLPVAAQADATLTKATPAADAAVAGSPAEIRLEFSEVIAESGSTVAVTGPAGHVENGKPLFEGNVMRIGLKPMIAGSYRVEWHATSVDNRAAQGSYTFTVK
jgi:copper resistance protein C